MQSIVYGETISMSDVSVIKTVPGAAGSWRVLIQWTSGRTQYVSAFENRDDAERWIDVEAKQWLESSLRMKL
jgi:hypothetical protein